jgi:hypothetical protein
MQEVGPETSVPARAIRRSTPDSSRTGSRYVHTQVSSSSGCISYQCPYVPDLYPPSPIHHCGQLSCNFLSLADILTRVYGALSTHSREQQATLDDQEYDRKHGNRL